MEAGAPCIRNPGTRIRDGRDAETVLTSVAKAGKGHAVSEFVSAFASALRQLKERSGVSYRDLAKRSLISTAALHRYCTGDTVPPDFDTVSRIAQVSGATRKELVVLHQQWLEARTAFEGLELEQPQRRVPAQLPPDVRGFSGRDAYLDRLDGMFDAHARRPSSPLACVITGTAGVGKTALAVHWAHRARDRFPDGQLYIDLRGFDPGRAVTTHDEAIHRLLTAMGISPLGVPKDLDSLIALYRTELDGRRMLLLLDNARDAEQVRWLLPGTASVMVLITSRQHLTSLVALNGTEQMVLDLLSEDDAMHLLSARLGQARVAREPEAAAAIVASCARLPLALTVAAARSTKPSLSLKDLAWELTDAGTRLDFLSAGDPQSEVRSVFSWSYERLTPAAARLFRLLGTHCGPSISISGAAALLGVDPKPLLHELAAASLVNEETPGRYSLHDLLRDYATALTLRYDSDRERELAVERVLSYYLGTACIADRALRPQREPPSEPITAITAVAVHASADGRRAMAWFTAEAPVLLALLRQAISSQRDSYTWHLAWSVTTFMTRRGPWHDLTWAWENALEAAQRLAHPLMRAEAHRHLVQCHTELGRFDEAWQHGQVALELCAEEGHLPSSALTHYALSVLCDRQGDPVRALDHAQAAYSDFVAAEHLWGQATSLNAIGWYKAQLGDYEAALADCARAMPPLRQLGDEHGQADTWDTMGFAHDRLTQHDQAVRCYTAAIGLYQQSGDRYYEAAAWLRLGDAYRCANQHDRALHAWHQALSIFQVLDHRNAQQVVNRIQAVEIGA